MCSSLRGGEAKGKVGKHKGRKRASVFAVPLMDTRSEVKKTH